MDCSINTPEDSEPLSNLSNTKCMVLGAGPGRTGNVDCNKLKVCLQTQLKSCQSNRLCYGYCCAPNSNTMAYMVEKNCGQLISFGFTPLPANALPLGGCPIAGAAGYGPLVGDEMHSKNCKGRPPGFPPIFLIPFPFPNPGC